MAPETRSRGVAPPSRVYNRTPTTHQLQFPARRTTVARRNDSNTPTPSAAAALKQQTLTQFDFVSSFEEDLVTLSDEETSNKENLRPGKLPLDDDDDDDDDEEEEEKGPVKNKRRRTLGDATEQITKRDSSRRKTNGDAPPSSNYHTQTLTQFLGHHTSFVADSDEEEEEAAAEAGDEGFLSWLGESPSAGRNGKRKRLVAESREDSVIPQTPTKRPGAATPESAGILIKRYGAPDLYESPLKNKALLSGSPTVQDSYATESWRSPATSNQLRTTPAAHEEEPESPTPVRKRAGKVVSEIPDSDEDDGGWSEAEEKEEGSDFAVGADTQAILSEIADTKHTRTTIPSSTQTSRYNLSRTSSTLTNAQPPVRKPLHHPPAAAPSQPFESQRVAASILRSLPDVSARSDILLPVPVRDLASLMSGHAVHIRTPFRIPSQVVRFWLFSDNTLRYMASIEHPAPEQYSATQVYELNNPLSWDDMLQEGWVDANMARYKYIPPAVVGQLLWNLRHALFDDEPENDPEPVTPLRSSQMVHLPPQRPSTPPGSSLSVSQQITAQIHSDMAHSTEFPLTSDNDDLVPSTPEDGQVPPMAPPPPAVAATGPNTIRPSQATTASQASTATPARPVAAQARSMPPPPSPACPGDGSGGGSLVFADSTGFSLGPGASYGSSLPLSGSQLLSKSQMLSDSLICDHAPPQATEIWDSDDDGAPLL